MSATSGEAGLWWALGQMTGQPAPSGLAAPYREAMAAFAATLPSSKPARAQVLARMLADLAVPPIARYVAELDPSWSAHLHELIEPRVLAVALGQGPGAAAPEPLRWWAMRIAAAILAPGALIEADNGPVARYTEGPWHEVQDALATEAARHLAEAAATQPGLLSAMANALADARDHHRLHQAAHQLGPGATGAADAARMSPSPRRDALRAFHACSEPKRLLEVAVRMLAPWPMSPAQRARLAHRLPRSMLPLMT